MRLDAVQGYGNAMSTQQVAQAAPIPDIELEAAPAADMPEGDQLIAEVGKQSGSDATANYEKNQQQIHQTEQEIEAENERIRKTLGDLNKKMSNNAEAVFGIHDKTNRVTIKMVDKDTKKVIKEFPPDKTLDMIAKVWELAGIMVDEKG